MNAVQYNFHRKNRKSIRKFFEKEASPEYQFKGFDCTVGRNPSDGRKRLQCPLQVSCLPLISSFKTWQRVPLPDRNPNPTPTRFVGNPFERWIEINSNFKQEEWIHRAGQFASRAIVSMQNINNSDHFNQQNNWLQLLKLIATTDCSNWLQFWTQNKILTNTKAQSILFLSYCSER